MHFFFRENFVFLQKKLSGQLSPPSALTIPPFFLSIYLSIASGFRVSVTVPTVLCKPRAQVGRLNLELR